MIRINLLSEGRRPVVARRTRPTLGLGDQDPSVFYLAGGILAGLLAVGVWFFLLNSEIKRNRSEIKRAEREYEELRPIIEEVDEFKAKNAEFERKISTIKDLQRKQRGPVLIMDQISRALPDLLWLEQMRVTGNTVQLRGRAFNDSAIGLFIGNLDQVPSFREPFLRDMQETRGGQTYSFNINFNFVYEEPEPAIGDEDGEGEGDGDEETDDA